MAEDFFAIQGLGGKRTLHGELPVRGSKNATLPALAAALLFDTPLPLENVPLIDDVAAMEEILESLGAEVKRTARGETIVDARRAISAPLPRELAKRMRASVIFAGPLLARWGVAAFPHPGGCVIGARPIDFFLEGFAKMGAAYEEGDFGYRLRAPKGGLRGADIFFRQVTVTGTETLMLAAARARGTTTLRNAALEPEVVFLAELLRAGGANIEGAGTPTITIEGSERPFAAPKRALSIIPDRIETGSFLILAALAGKDVSVTHCEPEHLRILIELLQSAGVSIEIKRDSMRVCAPKETKKPYKSFSLKTR